MLLEKLVVIICLLGSCVLQFGADFFVLGNISPDFLLMLTTYFAIFRGNLSGLWIGFFAGLLQDINLGSYSPLQNNGIQYFIGTYTLPSALMGYFAGCFSPYIRKNNDLIVLISLFILGIIKGILVIILVIVFHQGVDPSIFLSVILGESFYTGLIGILWFKFLKVIFPLSLEFQNIAPTKNNI